MLIGAHVSTSGGLHRAVERGEEMECDAIQIFNQSPRMWRPTKYGPDDFARFREAIEGSRVRSVVIHAIYLINPAGADREMRRKSMDSLVHALYVGDGIGADGVVVHPGALKDTTRHEALGRAIEFIAEALAESEDVPLLIENNAGSKQLLGLHFEELAALLEGAGGGDRLGVRLDSCHLFASGMDVRTPEAIEALVDQFDAQVGLDRLRCLHLNDSRAGLGELRDRHASIGQGEIGRKGMRAFLGEPRFRDLPVLLETPGPDGKGPNRAEVRLTKRLAAGKAR